MTRVNLRRPVRFFLIVYLAVFSSCAGLPGYAYICPCATAASAEAVAPPPATQSCPEPVVRSRPAQKSRPEIPKKSLRTPSARTESTSKPPAQEKAKPPIKLKNPAPKKTETAAKKPALAVIMKRVKTKRKAAENVADRKKVRVLIVGDSMAATDFGRALQKKLHRHPSIVCFRRGKSSTGLARPDFFDWMSEGAKQVRKSDPDFVIVVVGGNDGQDLIDREKKKRRVFWKGKKWAKAYAQRMTDFIELLAGKRRHVLWLELPAMDHRRLENKLRIIREIQRNTVSTLKSKATYVSTRQHFYDDDNRLIRKIRSSKKNRKVRLRQEDGIHFSLPGSRYFADRVYVQMIRALKL